MYIWSNLQIHQIMFNCSINDCPAYPISIMLIGAQVINNMCWKFWKGRSWHCYLLELTKLMQVHTGIFYRTCKCIGPLVEPLRVAKTCLKGSSLTWSKDRIHWSGLCSNSSKCRIHPLYFPVMQAVPSVPTIASLSSNSVPRIESDKFCAIVLPLPSSGEKWVR